MTELRAGFRDAPVEAAQAFRAVLRALAAPGTIVPLEAHLDVPAPLAATTAALVLTLVDNDTPLFLDSALSVPDVLAWVRFHAGAPVVPRIAEAAFAVIGDPRSFAAFAELRIGTAEYPDRSATLILQVDALASGRGATLSGPGIPGERRISLAPEPPRFWEALESNHALYPLGFDTLLAAPDAVVGVPRSTRIMTNGGA